jgi:hypothetical protein
LEGVFEVSPTSGRGFGNNVDKGLKKRVTVDNLVRGFGNVHFVVVATATQVRGFGHISSRFQQQRLEVSATQVRGFGNVNPRNALVPLADSAP